MKHTILVCLTLLLFSCKFSKEVTKQLSSLNNLKEQFGGSWSLSSDANRNYTLEITNSQRINEHIDSMHIFSTIIGRELINNSSDSIFNYLKIKCINEKKTLIITKSSSNQYSYNLNLINIYKEKPIDEYLFIISNLRAIECMNEKNNDEFYKCVAAIDTNSIFKNNIYNPLMHAYWVRYVNGMYNNKSDSLINIVQKSNKFDKIVDTKVEEYYKLDNRNIDSTYKIK